MQTLGKRQFRSQCLKQTLVLATPLEMKNTHAIEKICLETFLCSDDIKSFNKEIISLFFSYKY